MVITLIHGKDSFLSLLELKKLKEQIDPSISISSIDAEKADISEVIGQLESISMFDSEKSFIIKHISKNRKKADFYEYILSRLDAGSTLPEIVLFEGSKLASNLKIYKGVKKHGQINESPTLNKPGYIKWAAERFTEEGIEINRSTLKKLSENCNYSTERLANELTKIKLSGVKVVTEDIVVANSADTLESTVWDLISAINKGDRVRSSSILETLFTQRVEPIFIISMIGRNLRQAILVKHLIGRGEDSKSICSKLKIPPFTLPEIKRYQERYDAKTLVRLINRATNLDYQIKSGKIDPHTGLTMLMTAFR